MALIHCPDCEKEVSSRAVACPQCAYPIENLTNLVDAAMQNDVDMIRDLLRAGHNPNQANEGGMTPLIAACQQGSLSATKLIINAGGDVNYQDSSGFTPLMETAILGYDRIAQFLLEQGADPSIKNSNGETARDLAIKEEQHDLAVILNGHPNKSRKEKRHRSPEKHLALKIVPDASTPPKIPKDDSDFNTKAQEIRIADPEPPSIPVVEPPPLPEEEKISKPPVVRFVDDLAPVVDDEKYTGPGLICKTCRSQIAPEDIWCAHCKAPIIRRYCGGCHELIPDIAAQCPYCSSSKVHRFRYIRHMEQIVGGAVILGVLLFVLGIYNPQDSSSYAKKLAQQRSEQQEQKIIAAEETSKKQNQERQVEPRRTSSATTSSVVSVEPREKNVNEVPHASGIEDSGRIPTVERIETTPQSEAQKEIKIEENNSQAGEPADETEEPQIANRVKEQPELEPESEKEQVTGVGLKWLIA